MIKLPDDATRPHAPKIDGVTDPQRRRGQHLAAIHRMHLRELSRVDHAMEQVFAGNGSAETLIATISSMQMVGNMRQFGTLCGAACELLNAHHSIEDHWLFPALKSKTSGLTKVVERLAYEHTFIHQMITHLEAAAHALLKNASTENAKLLRSEFLQLETFVKSHFGYEQTELEEAIGFYNVEI